MLVDWDGAPVVSVSMVSRRAIEAALRPRHGGIIVDELVTMPGDDERQKRYAWKRGDVIELCSSGAYISRIGDPVNVVFVDLERIARAGDEWPDSVTIESSVQTENRVRTETVPFTATDVDQIFDSHFEASP